MKTSDLFYAIATGPARRRHLLTPVGLVMFFSLLGLVILGGRLTDRSLSLPAILPGVPGTLAGLFLSVVGALLWLRCIILFWHARGTPVPFNPPQVHVTVGPYARSRNPMLIGVFCCLFGAGLCLHSVGVVLLWTPAFIIFNALELKFVEEPELERRFGMSYADYKRRVPMFLPTFRFRTSHVA